MKYLIPLLIVLLISCDMDIKQPIKQNISDNNGVIVEDTSIKNKFQNDTVLYSEALLELLKSFMDEVDSIPNPFGRSVYYSLSFYKEGIDTMLQVLAYVDYPSLTEQLESYYECKGIFHLNNRNVAIFDRKESLGYKLYNINGLEQISQSSKDSTFHKWAEENMGWTFVPPYIVCRIERDSLVEVKRHMGKEDFNYYD